MKKSLGYLQKNKQLSEEEEIKKRKTTTTTTTTTNSLRHFNNTHQCSSLP